MSKTISYKQAALKAQSLDKQLTAYHFKGGSRVIVQHSDGTRFEFAWAFAVLWKKEYLKKEYLLVFTEHHGQYAFDVEDIDYYECSQKTKPMTMTECEKFVKRKFNSITVVENLNKITPKQFSSYLQLCNRNRRFLSQTVPIHS